VNSLKSNVEWQLWGKADPLWSVSSWPGKQKGSPTAWTDEEFYRVGESDWRDFFRQWQQYGVETRDCLEIGCGAGRITRQLGRTFDHVFGVDVSADMIERAAKAVGDNVEFAVIDGIHLPYADSSVSAVFSTHVFQHLDNVNIGYEYLREIFRVLRPGGTLMLHLPLYEWPTSQRGLFLRFLVAIYAVRCRMAETHADVRRFCRIKTMRGTNYPITPLYRFLCALGYRNIEFRVFPTTSNGDLHSFVLASK
jgi:ubiquinone/menaquinone biosynthesis C-methylase UbiE